MNLRMKHLAALSVSLLVSCSGCPGPQWEGAGALVSELRCGLSLEETTDLQKNYQGILWIETGAEPWDHAFRRGNTSVSLDFEKSRLVSYEISWESRLMYTEAMDPVNLCLAEE